MSLGHTTFGAGWSRSGCEGEGQVKEPTQKPSKLARYIEWTSRGRTGRLAYVLSKRNLPHHGPALRPRRLPPGAQQVEQARRQHHVTVLAAFALLHADDHPLAVDIGDLERNHLGGAQAGAIGHAQRRLVLQPRR